MRLINKYGEDEGLKRWDSRNKKCNLDLNGFIIRHGTIEGEKKYTKFINEKAKYNKQSNIALKLFNNIIFQYDEINEDEVFVFSSINGEFRIELDDTEKQLLPVNNIYLDFAFNNKVIEFYGDYWHKNPNKYDPSIPKHKEIIDYDIKRENIIKNRNYDLLIIWEGDYVKEPEKITNLCIEFLKTNQIISG